MNQTVMRWLEGSLFLIGLYWVFTNPAAVQRITQSGARAYVGSVRTLGGGGYNPGA